MSVLIQTLLPDTAPQVISLPLIRFRTATHKAISVINALLAVAANPFVLKTLFTIGLIHRRLEIYHLVVYTSR
jgi:hypothetical protein